MAVVPEIDDHTSGSEFPLAHPKPVVILIDGPVEENVALVGVVAYADKRKFPGVAGANRDAGNLLPVGKARAGADTKMRYARNLPDVPGRIDQFHRDFVALSRI